MFSTNTISQIAVYCVCWVEIHHYTMFEVSIHKNEKLISSDDKKLNIPKPKIIINILHLNLSVILLKNYPDY